VGLGILYFLLSEKEGSEAELVSKKIIEMLIKKQINNFNDVAVLCREKGDFEELEKSFTNSR
jgi:superfamily I DNA/RNA helicase